MNIENLTQDQIDALTAAAVGSIKIVVPTLAGAPSFVPMSGAIVKINGFSLVEGVDWTAGTSAAATATSLADAITSATADMLCTATPNGTDASLVDITANTAGAAGNSISISVTHPGYTFPSGATLLHGTIPSVGDVVFNIDDDIANLYASSGWVAVDQIPAVTTVQVISGDPVSPVAGQVWFDSGSKTWRAYDGTDKGTLTFSADA